MTIMMRLKATRAADTMALFSCMMNLILDIKRVMSCAHYYPF